jgi:hypothetical protein
MKTAGLFYFADEPQFSTTASRAWLANALRSYRNVQNGNNKRYTVTRHSFGRYTVRLNTQDSPVAVIITH